MAVLSSNQITFIDMTDNRLLTVNVHSSVPECQIYEVNTEKYIPSWEYTNAVLTPEIYLNSVQLPLTTSGLSISWTRKDGTNAETSLSQDSGEYVLSNRIQITKNILQSSSGMVTYICKATYQGITAYAQYSFYKLSTGKNAEDNRLLLTHNVLSSAQNTSELIHPLTDFNYLEIFYHDDAGYYNSSKVRNNKESQCNIRLEQSHMDTMTYYGANLLLQDLNASLPNESNIKMTMTDQSITQSTTSVSYIVVDAMYGLI